jgi:multicomponent Na+:H+ antiporter subunit G
MSEIFGYIFLSIGVAFNLFGCIGLLRLPDVYSRLQASTKCVTMGTWCMLIAVLIFNGFSATGMKAVFCIFLISLSSPTAAHAIARGAHISGVNLWKKSVVDRLKEDKKNI